MFFGVSKKRKNDKIIYLLRVKGIFQSYHEYLKSSRRLCKDL